MLAALGDGLLQHVLLEPELDVAAAIEALRALLGAREPGDQWTRENCA